MKLITKQMAMNDQTFAPELHITVSVPVELLQDKVAQHGIETVYADIGRQFIELLKSN